jgi:hypothetical protein
MIALMESGLMSLAFAIIGCVVVLGFAVAAIIAASGYFVESSAKARWHRDQILSRDSKRDLGASMASLAHWFTEDVAAWKAVEIIGLEIQRKGDFDVSECRTRWRQEVRDEIAGTPGHDELRLR